MSSRSTKRILLINNAYPTEWFPKRGSYVKSIEERLVAANFEVDRIVLDSGYNKWLEKILSYLKFYFRLISFNKYGSYDYVYIHHFPNVFMPLIGKLGKMRNVVVNFHGGDIVYTSNLAKFMNAIAYRFLSSGFSYIVPSGYFKNKVILRIPKLRHSQIYISPSGGIDTDLFKPFGKKIIDEHKPLQIGFASGIDYNKGVEDLLRIMEVFNTKDYRFHVIDYGNHRQKYIQKIDIWENVVLHPPFKKEEMPRFYNLIDVLFFPTKSDSLGLVALEAMSCNVPVIGPDDFALKDIIVPRVSGEKYNASITEEYFAAFQTFIKNRKQYCPKRLIQETFSKERVTQQFKEIFV